GDRFVFSGRVVELLRVRDNEAIVQRAKTKRGIVPRWGGGRTPLSTLLAETVREKLRTNDAALTEEIELQAVAPLLAVQRAWSRIPGDDELLIEQHKTKEGHHVFLFPFEGRLVHEGLGALLAYRLTQATSMTLTVTANDYGVELASQSLLDAEGLPWRELLTAESLVDDLLLCLNTSELARRRFRDIARVAGLINQGYPGQKKKSRQLQASSELFFDVFTEFDPENMLLDQARREVLEQQLEVERLRNVLGRLGDQRLVIEKPVQLTPIGFPLWAESLRTQQVSSEKWTDRIAGMAMRLEKAADEVV
ncbi:MAG: DNA ligase-associated DEXH box helicase, partial [Planctomycetota bacterium]